MEMLCVDRSAEVDQLVAAQVAAFADMPANIAATKQVDTGKFTYKYAPLSDVIAQTKPILAQHGLAISQCIASDGVWAKIMHSSGQWESYWTPIHHEQINKELETWVDYDPKLLGSYTTYVARYQIARLCCVSAEEDDGGHRGDAYREERRSARKPAPKEKSPVDNAIEWLHEHSIDVARVARTLGSAPTSWGDEELRRLRAFVKAYGMCKTAPQKRKLVDSEFPEPPGAGTPEEFDAEVAENEPDEFEKATGTKPSRPSRKRKPKDTDVLKAGDVRDLCQFCDAVGVSRDEIIAYLEETYGIDSRKKLNYGQLKDVYEWLRSQKGKGAPND
jgi:hypothetical protein